MRRAVLDWAKTYKPENAIYIIVCFIYTALRILNFDQLDPPRFTPDSTVYINIAGFSFLDLNFWTGNRPPFYPFLIKACGQDLNALTIFQLCLSIVAWILLAYSLSRQMNDDRFGLLAFIVILLFSANIMIIPWDAAIMTESLNFSLVAIILGLWFLQTNNKSRIVLNLLILITFLWTFLRETNAWLVFIAGGVILVLGVWQQKKENRNHRDHFVLGLYD